MTGKPCNPTGQTVVETYNCILKEVLKRKKTQQKPRGRTNSVQLTLNFLNVNEKGITAAERYWAIEKAVEFNQPIYYTDVFTSEWIPAKAFHWECGFVYISSGNGKLWIQSRLIKIRIKQERSPEKLGP